MEFTETQASKRVILLVLFCFVEISALRLIIEYWIDSRKNMNCIGPLLFEKSKKNGFNKY